ncbi:MAG: response regulator transcription factor [Oscillospiraceae bacterium]|nr:response regulator transcription factor [Oscillospiraceae bacterium]
MIYCVEDDDDIRGLITYAVSSSGYGVQGFDCAVSFEEAMKKAVPDLILLDIMLPDKDGIEILKNLRANMLWRNIPVIMLTAKSSEMDKVKGFEIGADDYVTKPFSVLELISRIKAVLKRTSTYIDRTSEYNGIRLDLGSRTVTVDGEKVSLTFKEFELLSMLMENMGSVVNRETLLDKIWGYRFEGESRTLDVHIGSLRHKLGEKGKLIETIRNVGYGLK